MLTQDITDLSKLNNELRAFAESILVATYQPAHAETKAAVEPYFPEIVTSFKNSEQILDEVGLSVITQLGPNLRISWSVADNAADAAVQLEQYGQSEYRAIRKAFNINNHWVIQVRPNFWGYDDDQIINGHITFDETYGSPECWILNLSGK